MVELFPNIDNIPLPGKALCPPAEIQAGFPELTKNLGSTDGVALLLFESHRQQQQQQQQ